jgi:hypothetical protein
VARAWRPTVGAGLPRTLGRSCANNLNSKYRGCSAPVASGNHAACVLATIAARRASESVVAGASRSVQRPSWRGWGSCVVRSGFKRGTAPSLRTLCGLTPRSSGPPTAWRLGRAAVLFIIVHAAKAPHRWRPLNSHVRPLVCEQSELEVSRVLGASGDGHAGLLELRRHGSTPRLKVRGGWRFALGPAAKPVLVGQSCGSVRVQAWHRLIASEPVRPNPSFKRTANGVAPWPRGRVVYHRPRGQGATPLAAA